MNASFPLADYLKTKRNFAQWKRYYYVLDVQQCALLRYKTHKDYKTQQPPRESIPLLSTDPKFQVQVVDGYGLSGKSRCIALLRAGFGPLVLRADTEADAQRWLQRLQQLANTQIQQQQSASSPQQSAHMVQLLEACLDPAVVSDESGCILGFNTAAEKLFGWPKAEIVGKNVRELMPDTYSRHHDRYMDRYKISGDKHLLGCPRGLVAKHRDGSIIPVMLSLGEVEAGSVKYFVGMFRESVPAEEGESRTPTPTSASSSSVTPLDPFPTSLPLEMHIPKSNVCPVTGMSGDAHLCPVGPHSSSSAASSEDLSESGDVTPDITPRHVELFTARAELDEIPDHDRVAQMTAEMRVLQQENARKQRAIEALNTENRRLADQCERQHQRLEKLEAIINQMQLSSSADAASTSREKARSVTILQLLQNETTFTSLTEFCRDKHCDEMCLFYRDVQQFKKRWRHVAGRVTELRREARDLFERYFTSESPQEINISGTYRKQLKELIDSPDANTHALFSLFDSICDDVAQQLYHNTYGPFISTSEGRAALRRL